MEPEGLERLFLLEFMVYNIQFYHSMILDKRILPTLGGTSVKIQFRSNPLFEISEDDFCALNQSHETTDITFRSGKSCLFALRKKPGQWEPYSTPLQINVIRRLPRNENSEFVPIGQACINLPSCFTHLLNETGDSPHSEILKDLFNIINVNNDVVGTISFFIRLSYFGKIIVTQFQMKGLENKSFLFKGDLDSNSEYNEIKEVNKDSLYKEMKSAMPESEPFKNSYNICRRNHEQEEIGLNSPHQKEFSELNSYFPQYRYTCRNMIPPDCARNAPSQISSYKKQWEPVAGNVIFKEESNTVLQQYRGEQGNNQNEYFSLPGFNHFGSHTGLPMTVGQQYSSPKEFPKYGWLGRSDHFRSGMGGADLNRFEQGGMYNHLRSLCGINSLVYPNLGRFGFQTNLGFGTKLGGCSPYNEYIFFPPFLPHELQSNYPPQRQVIASWH